MGFTPEQIKVTESRNKNLIVSAAAGSGKTSVLTERIIRKICPNNEDDSYEKLSSIDRMLIVTFTNAAAREMRERIGKKLREELKKNPGNPVIRKQIAILHTAQITTIDSFCLYILKNHFEEIGLDPAFAIGTEGEIKQISEDAFEEALEQAFAEGKKEFLNLVEMYAPRGKFGEFFELVTGIANTVDSMPYPYKRLESFIKDADTDVWQSDFIAELKKYEDEFLDEAVRVYNEIKNLTEGSVLVKHYQKACGEISFLQSVRDKDFKSRLGDFSTHEPGKLAYGAKKFLPEEAELKAIVDEKNKYVSDIIKEVEKDFHSSDKEEFEALYKEGLIVTNSLVEFVISYMRIFDAKKRDKGLVSFSDMEHMALEILVDEDGNPTKTALSYRDFFDEVMIDEYQDSNEVQETILSNVSRTDSESGNRFMVGDIKQSIYRFRHAEPGIFREKCEEYEKSEDAASERINLTYNFRSRGEVIDAINYIFERCMKKEVGEVSYDDAARLYLGKTDYPESNSDNRAELIFFNKTEFEETEAFKNLSKDEIEAKIVARKIRNLIEEKKQVFDNNKQAMRDIEFSDIAILMRGMSGGQDVIYQKALKDENIPAYVISKSGYYSALEVQLILNFLSVIDNPRQDLPLLGVLNSFIGNFTQEEIAKIRKYGRKKRLIDSMYLYLLEGSEASIKAKITGITDDLDDFRKKAMYMSASDLIREIYEKYEYTIMVSSLPGGEQRLANVNLLAETADEYEEQGIYCIHDFIKYTEKLKARQDMGEANMLDENANVVKIMTIHKSKGLEFPVCFVCGMHSKFVPPKGKVLIDKEYGPGGDTFNLEKRIKGVSPVKKAIAVKEKKAGIGEEIRVLYVALTRAKEKLIMTGMLNEDLEAKDDLTFVDIMKANSFMKMVYPIVREKKDLFALTKVIPADFEINAVFDDTERAVKKKALKDIDYKSDFKEFEYPHESLEGLFVKTTVSELKKAAYLEREDGENTLYHEEEKRIPKIIAETESENGGARRGSAYHRVMELMDFPHVFDGDTVSNLRIHRQKMVENLFIDKEDDALVNEKKVLEFLDTDLAKRMSAASVREQLYLEQPFVLSVNAKDVKEEFPSDEKILVQGVIDVYFEEDGKLILMDYKTDRVESAEELINRYKTQLHYYAEALSRLEKKPVAEILIYSFALGKTIRL